MAEPTQLDRIEAAIANLTNIALATRSVVRTTLAQELEMENVFDPIPAAITALTNQVTAEQSVEQSAITLLNGLSGQVANLGQQLAQAISNAADPAQVSAIAGQLTTLASTVQSNASALAAAVTANTPVAPSSAATPKPPTAG